jgi:predicted phosphodiesterase
MTYAIFSDIHGNYPALRAALDDARERGAESYLFLGDYFRDFPWANETAALIRGLTEYTAIGGNNEGYLRELKSQVQNCGAQCQNGWTHIQFNPIYYCYNQLSKDNLEYFTSLPDHTKINCGNCTINLFHVFGAIYRNPRIAMFSSSNFRKLLSEARLTHNDYLELAREALFAREDAMDDVRNLDKGIYLFGHNHLQFHAEYEGRVLINPGSCGVALDGDNSAAYTLLEIRGDGSYGVDERRAAYDAAAAAAMLRGSEYADHNPAWVRIILKQLDHGLDYFGPFIRHVMRTGLKYGETETPVSNDVFNIAAKTWDPDIII